MVYLDKNDRVGLVVSILQAVYIIYIFNFFETTYSCETSRKLVLSGILFHPVKDSNIPISHICPFGHMMAYPIAVYLIGRHFVLNDKPDIKKKYSFIINTLIFLGSLMNLNAIVYLIPFFITEFVFH